MSRDRDMRTIVDLDQRIWLAARAKAFRDRVSVSHLANLAFRDFLGLKLEVKPRPIGRPAKKKAAAKPASKRPPRP